jgi:hypothetical protein
MSDVRVAQLSRGALVALVFQNLSRHRPDLDAGIYACAKAGFGNYLGFVAALGYLIVCCLADLACLLLIKGTLGRENAQGAPHRALLMTDLAVHAFLIVTWFAESAFTIALRMTRAMTLLPCLMVAGLRGGHALVGRRQVPAVAALLYAPGTLLFIYARREPRKRAFARGEVILFAVFSSAALAALVALATGTLTLC